MLSLGQMRRQAGHTALNFSINLIEGNLFCPSQLELASPRIALTLFAFRSEAGCHFAQMLRKSLFYFCKCIGRAIHCACESRVKDVK